VRHMRCKAARVQAQVHVKLALRCIAHTAGRELSSRNGKCRDWEGGSRSPGVCLEQCRGAAGVLWQSHGVYKMCGNLVQVPHGSQGYAADGWVFVTRGDCLNISADGEGACRGVATWVE
jgi:hypothetical protein